MTNSMMKCILILGIMTAAFLAPVQLAYSADLQAIEAVIHGQINGDLKVQAGLFNTNTAYSIPVNSITHQAGYPEGSNTIKVGTFQMVVPNTNITPILYDSFFRGENLTITLKFYRHKNLTTELNYTIVLTNANIVDIRTWSPLGPLPSGVDDTDPSQLTLTLECQTITWTWIDGGITYSH